MASLITLPNELFNNVLRFVPREDLSAMTRTCKQLSHLTRPTLYHDVNFIWTEDDAQHHPIHLLLRSIAENADLAEMVKHLSLRTRGFCSVNARSLRPDCGPEPQSSDLAIINNMINNSGLPWPQTWEWAIARGTVGALIALLITRLPSVISLHIGLNLLCNNTFLSKAMEHMMAATQDLSQSRFQHLQHIRLGTGAEDIHFLNSVRSVGSQFYINHFLSFFSLSGLQSAEMQIPRTNDLVTRSLWGDERLQHYPLRFPPLAERLTSLSLTSIEVTPITILPILQTSKNLETLRYSYVYRDSTPVFDCQILGRALSEVENTLKSLSVLVKPVYAWQPLKGPNDHFIHGSLACAVKACTRLEDLDLPFPILMGWSRFGSADLVDALPRSLHRFRLRNASSGFHPEIWCEQWCLDKLKEFFGHSTWRHATPVLEEVSLRLLARSEDQWSSWGREALRNMVKGQGLRCNIV